MTEWCRERKISKPLLQFTEEELNDNLRKFYAEARNQKGEEYSRSSLLGFRNAIERHFSANGRPIKLTNNHVFYSSNKILECKLKVNRREGKENTQHKPIIEPADIVKIKKSPFLSHENPYGLLRRVWFIVCLYWCRRGNEGQRHLRRESFDFHVDADGKEYATTTHKEQTKNHQGGFRDKQSYESETKLYSTGEVGDSLWCLKKYISKLNPRQQAFFQRPVSTFRPEDAVWYENKPIGVNKLSDMMKSISIGAGLSKRYTNHSVRATAITMWSDAEIPARHIMNISGHVNEQSISHYNRRPSSQQLKKCSDVISSALTASDGRVVVQEPDEAVSSTFSTASTVQASQANVAFNSVPQSIFNGCSIQTVNVYVLQPNASQ